MTWDDWRSSYPDHAQRPVMWIKRIASLLGRGLDLHKFVEADVPGCFHTHPYRALRFVLWGGYVEEILRNAGAHPFPLTDKLVCGPGHMGFITPRYAHRVDSLLDGPSYSLWFRGPTIAKVKLLGPGWKEEGQDR